MARQSLKADWDEESDVLAMRLTHLEGLSPSVVSARLKKIGYDLADWQVQMHCSTVPDWIQGLRAIQEPQLDTQESRLEALRSGSWKTDRATLDALVGVLAPKVADALSVSSSVEGSGGFEMAIKGARAVADIIRIAQDVRDAPGHSTGMPHATIEELEGLPDDELSARWSAAGR